MFWFYGISIFVLSSALLYIAGELIVSGLLRISKYFKVTEFVVAFFVLAFAATLPNFFVGITSAMQGVPELSFGDIMGNNMIALTLAAAVGVFFAPKKSLPLENQTIRDTTFLTSLAALLPLILISDGVISRSDGLILVLFFACYVYWLFSKSERFTKTYEGTKKKLLKKDIFIDFFSVLAGALILVGAAQGIVYGGTILAESIGLSLVMVGILIVGFGGALPEVYFTVLAARRGDTSMIIGNLMGAVIIPATLVLGIVAMIHPIHNDVMELSVASRMFLVVAALFFLMVSQTKNSIQRREGIVLLGIYVAFLLHLFVFI